VRNESLVTTFETRQSRNLHIQQSFSERGTS
jgi:hypothetical protein